MIKRKVFYIIILALLLFIILYFINSDVFINFSNQVKIIMYGEPINLANGMINNDFFNINSNATARGINDALEYAYKNNIQYVCLEKGIYEINESIHLISNIHLDLNGSTIEYIPNSNKTYSLLRIENQDNVIISNGFLKGDRYEHDYSQDNSTHEWGLGIRITSSTNIEIFNLNISEMTGDGIYISQNSSNREKLINSENIKIHDCMIHDNRRQGITIISGENIDIYSNEIFDINGVNPKSAICIESNYDYEKSDNINIYDNKFYNLNGNYSIYYYRNLYNSNIYNNEISGKLFIHDVKGLIKIHDNIMNNANISCGITEEEKENGFTVAKVIIENNNMQNSNIKLTNCEKSIIHNNTIYNQTIEVKNSESAIINNIVISNSEQLQYGYIYGDNSNDYFTIYEQGNKIIGNISNMEKIYSNVIINNNIEEFIENF